MNDNYAFRSIAFVCMTIRMQIGNKGEGFEGIDL
jgi:hypothetical protein